jgi:hypothetical protein
MKVLAIGERFNQERWSPVLSNEYSFSLRVRMGLYNRGPRREFLDKLGVRWTHGINLLWPSPTPGEWDNKEAQQVVAAIASHVVCEYDYVLLFGRRVCDAWGVPYRVGQVFDGPVVVSGYLMESTAKWMPLPHPSGRNRAWNDPEVKKKVRALAESL